jgi:hypothetical protein
MNKEEAEKRLAGMRAGARRLDMIQSGAYDGRFKSRSVQSKRHRDEKHKKNFLNELYSRD